MKLSAWLFLTVVLIYPTCVLHAAPIDTLLDDPEAASSFDYCHWIQDGGDPGDVLSRIDQILDDESTSEVAKAAAVLARGGMKVARDAPNPRLCRQHFARGRELFEKQLARHARRLGKDAARGRSQDEEIAAAQVAISNFWVEDQSSRLTYIDLKTEEESGFRYWALQSARAHGTLVDAEATKLMRSVLEDFDWVDIERFGARVSNHAWLLVQHADDHPDFQAEVLRRMEPYLDSGGVKKANYAYLWDRAAVNAGRPQRYGTQPIWECKDGRLELQPVEDPAGVNERRAAMGMDTVEEGLAAMARSVCR